MKLLRRFAATIAANAAPTMIARIGVRTPCDYDHAMQRVVTMIGGGLSQEEAEATRAVVRRAGFDGPCEPILHGQGEGIAVVVIQVALPIFLQPFLQPVADGAAERLKEFFRDLHRQTDWGRESLQQQVFIRPDAISHEEWVQSRGRGRMPGWREEDPTEPELVLTSLMPDEAWEALAELDVESLEGGRSYSWSDEHREWRPSNG